MWPYKIGLTVANLEEIVYLLTISLSASGLTLSHQINSKDSMGAR